jgi:hypothetical protein
LIQQYEVGRVQRCTAGDQADAYEVDIDLPNFDDRDRGRRIEEGRQNCHQPGKRRMPTGVLVKKIPSGMNKRRG